MLVAFSLLLYSLEHTGILFWTLSCSFGETQRESLGGFCMRHGATMTSLEALVGLCVLLDDKSSQSCMFLVLPVTH